ncbi:hypothetical protein IRY30_01970 [Corynebacterium sp. DSM 45110]|uniref:Uncharacterized protein n=1 Tax=Corynebacterium suicordis DSM 45110 TaxID=1121369 RepID=A0ABR9ZHJ6_9CORY|nr:hypothetical protein [Corynebacterium suicordis DSM 45110]
MCFKECTVGGNFSTIPAASGDVSEESEIFTGFPGLQANAHVSDASCAQSIGHPAWAAQCLRGGVF